MCNKLGIPKVNPDFVTPAGWLHITPPRLLLMHNRPSPTLREPAPAAYH